MKGLPKMGESLLGVIGITVLLFLVVAATGFVVFGNGDDA
jgi:hypothetical protein